MHSECGINNRPNPLHPKFFLPKRSPPDIEANFPSLSLSYTHSYTHLRKHTYKHTHTHSLSLFLIYFISFSSQLPLPNEMCLLVVYRRAFKKNEINIKSRKYRKFSANRILITSDKKENKFVETLFVLSKECLIFK